MKRILKDSKGVALVIVIFVATALFTIVSSALLFSSLDLKLTGNRKLSDAAIQVADTGIHHALAVIPVGTTFSYTSETTILNSVSFGGGYSYTVKAINDPASSGGNSRAILTSTALGPNGTKKVIVAYIGRGSLGLGATSLPGSSAATTETNFSGTSFSINGNDNCNTAPPVPGIVVTDPALATEITNNTTSDGGLASNQMGLVTGAGGSPSVATIAPLAQTVSQIAEAYLALPHTTLSGGNYSSNENWGTASSPRITRITGDAQIQGTVEGYGVLIVEGNIEVAGNFTFYGLVIARGDAQVQITGNAGIYGSLVIGESITQDAGFELDVRGNANIRFDSCALSPANSWVSLPKKAKLLAWQEKFT